MTVSQVPEEAAGAPGNAPHDLRERYLDLLRSTLTFSLWDGRDGTAWAPRPAVRRLADLFSQRAGVEIVRTVAGQRGDGRDWPRLAHTMTGVRRMESLQYCVEQVLRDGVAGDLIETGVWRGGSCILMRGVLAAYGDTERTVWVADSFEGLPPPDPARYAADAGDTHHQNRALAVSLEEVRDNFRRYGLLDGQVRFLKGWFRDTLPAAPIDRLAVLRLDGDMYESTVDALRGLYPKLSPGGFCVVDDYGAIEGCRAAVDDFRRTAGIEEEIVRIDWTGVYWRKAAR
ncbi:TylF/MycF family methyltransferase [Parafrankia discariae]|uniref:TylF/MycF family methyltransferase n=1 Tax=Parafrankia discariae TaxID=365528 RepID=UPI0003A93CC1|nr:TylF/MycF family methyltransferase [Parafrankia discariae]